VSIKPPEIRGGENSLKWVLDEGFVRVC